MIELDRNAIWDSTLALLETISKDLKRDTERPQFTRLRRLSQETSIKPVTPGATARIEFIGCNPAGNLTIACRDSTAGHYGAQTWKLSRARQSGHCVLSGDRIRRGDDIYKPSTRGHFPHNADWMMLASKIPRDLKHRLVDAFDAADYRVVRNLYYCSSVSNS
ncbi:DUF3331 domain-containing protein [Paraburkholderia bannensis]|uniref:DUF3331 domain-containing protein n=1 Tax=Paraburkholderia bannensis TaxID=765414 RepID=UPI000A029F7D|nr:DUF3331 domain-containing protein [Paraburkholderia bannensis]